MSQAGGEVLGLQRSKVQSLTARVLQPKAGILKPPGRSIIWTSCLKYGFPGSPSDSGSGVQAEAWAFTLGDFWGGRLKGAYGSRLEKRALQVCSKGPFMEAFDSSEETMP